MFDSNYIKRRVIDAMESSTKATGACGGEKVENGGVVNLKFTYPVRW
jgi:hypothetical protein